MPLFLQVMMSMTRQFLSWHRHIGSPFGLAMMRVLQKRSIF